MPIPTPLIVAVVILVLLAVAASFVRLIGRQRTAQIRANTDEAVPALLTPTERSFFGVLQQAVASDYQIFTKVRLADIARPVRSPNRSGWQTAFNRITGGKIMSSKTRAVKRRSAEALRLAAQSLWRAKNHLGDCFRRWKARWGTAKAITAMAHKLARILGHMIRFHQPYDPTVGAAAEEKLKKKKLHRLQQTAVTLGYKLICAPTT